MKINRNDSYFIIKTSLFYCAISLGFSFSGILLPDKTHLVNPLSAGAFNAYEIAGHILWGLAAAVVTMRLKYILLGGAFAVLIDSDHIVGVLQIEEISRMSHSIVFATISIIVIMLVFGKKDYILGAVAGASVFSHMSYDLFVEPTGFPLFTPFYNITQHFASSDWIHFEMIAIVIIGVVTVLARENASKSKQQPKP
jgi:hypothetical protein